VWDVSARKMTIKGAFAGITGGFFGSVQIEMNSIVNPKDNTKVDSFSIYTYDDPALT
jgi:hypothetical protein